jgi:hypothetical protein
MISQMLQTEKNAALDSESMQLQPLELGTACTKHLNSGEKSDVGKFKHKI